MTEDDDEYVPRPSAVAVLVALILGAVILLGVYMLVMMVVELGRAMPVVIGQAQLMAAG